MRDPLVIHVVRHGRTRSNRVGLVMGWADESIEPDQHDAADAVAARLAAAPAPVRVVSSPLARARDTAAPLAAALSVDLETDARLGELYQGPWQGLCKVAQDRAIGGPLLGPSAYFMKSPPIQYRDEEARELVDEFAR
jgi:broad specificity phosphatase PhoE